jgi:hypothetical protein
MIKEDGCEKLAEMALIYDVAYTKSIPLNRREFMLICGVLGGWGYRKEDEEEVRKLLHKFCVLWEDGSDDGVMIKGSPTFVQDVLKKQVENNSAKEGYLEIQVTGILKETEKEL